MTTRFTLDNGLRVVVGHDPTTAMAAVNILYNVGARDEDPSSTGLAHLFEHLMFGGSKNIPSFDAAIERAGGVNNAWTSNDFTCFHDIAPAVNLETLLWLESDRMLELAFSEKSLEVQRNVVIEEFKQVCLNKPYGDLSHRLRSMLYSVHPYRYPTIGRAIEDIEGVTMERVREFFFSHYAPNNAVFAVAGSVEPERVRELVEKWFSDIPRREIALRRYPAEPPRTEASYSEMEGRVPQTALFVAYPMCGQADPDFPVFDLLTDVLANGNASRMYRRLVMPGDLFSTADASVAGSEEPGYLLLSGRLLQSGADAEKRAFDALERQIAAIAADGVGERELQRAFNRFVSTDTFSNIDLATRASTLALDEMHGETRADVMARYRAVTSDDIRRVAAALRFPARIAYRPLSE